MKFMKIILVSPVPPMKTGTANYLKLLIRDLSLSGIKEVAVVYDESSFETVVEIEAINQKLKENCSISIDLIEKSNFYERDGDIVIYFTANNHFHFYVYDLLLQTKKSKRYIVVHEPSTMMAATSYFEWDRVCSRKDFAKHLSAQFGNRSNILEDDIRFGRVLESLQYEVIGFDYALFNPDVIYVHSKFAKAKLQIELDLDDSLPIKVAGHPFEDPLRLNDSSCQIKKNFGIFGFVNPSKRIYQVMNGFKRFIEYCERAGEDITGVNLLVVGQLPPAFLYSPKKHAKKIGISKYCKFYGYVSKNEFNDLYASCQAVFNLRFPSCGETTGLSGYDGMGPKLVMSDYHAFSELSADYFVDLDNEEDDIFEVFLKVHSNTPRGSLLGEGGATETIGFAISRDLCRG